MDRAQEVSTYGFIRKHWLGEYSFPRSFWFHTILLAWFIPGVALSLLSLNTWHINARGCSVAFVAIFVIYYPSLLWGTVGTARAGKRYKENGGSRSWVSGASVVIGFLFVNAFYFLLDTRAIVIQHIHMAFTGKYGPPASISLIDNGTRLLLTGELQEGTAAAFVLAMNRPASVTTVVMDSKGGLFQEAIVIARSISQHGLDTYVDLECSSACTLAFLGGRHRCVAEGARIGFHAATYARDLSGKTYEDIADYQRDLYVKAGVSRPFVDTIMATPSRRIWYPSRQELLEARVTTPDCP